ncbi:MAG: hypothetical protein GY810_08540 [Aureispira sp.]|nr:hypothetical protein [Aureispira sp.]
MLTNNLSRCLLLSTLLLVMLFFAACETETGTTYIQNVDNRTDKSITILFLPGFNNTASLYGDTVVIPPFQVKEILLYFDKESNTPIKQFCGVYDGDPIKIEIEGGGTLTKDLTKDEDWEYVGDINEQVCTFVIEENHIQQ